MSGSTDSGKTVYILGAGFSRPAGGPTQAEILEEIWLLDGDPKTEQQKETLKRFLVEDLNVNERFVSLEDIYTPIDRCLADGLSLRGKTGTELSEIREILGHLISRAIQECFRKGPVRDPNYVGNFAEYLVRVASVRAERAKGAPSAKEAKAYDPFSVISLNWDILLDNALDEALRRNDPPPHGDYDPFGVVDYCCYISSIDSNDGRIRSGLWSMGCRGYNLKLLKLHGSMNWLQCPNCQRLFVGFGEKIHCVDS
jgi:hypothetical protein